jgi:hypothetical protein
MNLVNKYVLCNRYFPELGVYVFVLYWNSQEEYFHLIFSVAMVIGLLYQLT